MTPHDAVTFGEVMALLLAAGRPLDEAAGFELSYAGAEANVAIGLARLGHRVAWMGRVGGDSFGRGALRALRGEGVDVSAVVVDGERPTGLLLRDAVSDRPITVDYRRSGSAGSALGRDDLDHPAIARARVLHLTAITGMLSATAREASLAAVAAARDGGATVVLDPNVRLRLGPAHEWRAYVELLAGHSDAVLVGAGEAELLTGSRGAGWFIERGVSRVVVKDGRQGACETDGSALHRTGVRSVPVVDPVGAGDAFAAGWISGWLRGLDPARRLWEASVVASCVVGAFGDHAGLPDAATRDALVDGANDVDR